MLICDPARSGCDVVAITIAETRRTASVRFSLLAGRPADALPMSSRRAMLGEFSPSVAADTPSRRRAPPPPAAGRSVVNAASCRAASARGGAEIDPED